MQQKTGWLVGALATAGLGLGSSAGTLDAERPQIVAELFTSQGCSSCPPAEALLGELATRADVLPIAFHVTYWNALGWRDRFSIPEADARQYRYAAAFAQRSVYTPQLVINGLHAVVGSNRRDVLAALVAATRPAGIAVTLEQRTLRVQLPELAEGCDCDLLLLGVRSSAETAISQGENAGRSVREVNVVRYVQAQPGWDGRGARRVLRWDRLPADATRLVVLAQRRSNAQVVAVGTMTLSSSRRPESSSPENPG